MALEIKNATGKFGYAHLVFDREIDADHLMLAFYNLIRREYLAHSVSKVNWTPSRSNFFKALLVERGQGRSTFLIGPEVTTFINDETSVEVTSEDETLRERAVWSGILKNFNWNPEPQADPDKEKADREKAEREEAVRKEREAREREAEARRLRDEAAQRDEQARKRSKEARLAEEEAMRLEAERLQREKDAKPPRSYKKALAAFAALIVLAGGALWGSQNRDFLCDQFNLFCSAETLAYRKVEACAKPLNCGAGACYADYRRDYPQGAHKTLVDRIAADKGNLCVDRVELALFNGAKACADSKSCGARSCFAEYRRIYPDGPHKADIDRMDAAKGADCPVDAELHMFERAKACAAPMFCGADACLTDYRRVYPNGRFKAEVDRIAADKPTCRNPEQEAVDRAEACARPLTCGVESACLGEYRRTYPNGSLKARIDALAAQKPACRDLEGEAYQRAEQCAARLPGNCGASSCIAEYRGQYPNGRYKAQIDRIDAEKGRSCFPPPVIPTPTPTGQPTPTPDSSLPPFNPRPASQDAGMRCEALQNPEPVEQMICADADLARANADLERAWRAMQPAQRQRIRQGQRDWIERRDSECSIQRSGTWDQMALRQMKNCFIEKTRARTNELQ